MANYVKYSTNAQTRALKMGNFWLGPVNDGKGPTSSTGYYTAKNPPSGGFTIYANKTSNGPSIFQASNESQLVSITNQLGETSFTTSAQCLTWYVTQTDKFCVNREYEGIVTNGLVLNLDAGFTPSYPTSGTSWYDLGPSGNTGTLTNGPTFTSTNGGTINFDATDEWVNVSPNSSLNLSSQGTIGVWCYPNSLTQENYAGLIGMTTGGQYAQQSYYLHWRQTDNIIQGGIGNNGTYNVASCPLPTSIGWYNFVFTWNGSNVVLYRNGVSVSSATQTVNAQSLSSAVKIGGRMFYPDAPGAGEFNGRISIAQIYNRGLTAYEILQNYNAQKGRFGL